MDFNIFEQRISKIKDLPLPGEISHYKMVPELRLRELTDGKVVRKDPKKAAVMALFYPASDKGTRLLCILRNTYEGVHSDQVALPGGKVEDTDGRLINTALRETYEEVGVHPNDVEVVRSLSEVYIPPSNFEVHPFIGLYKKPEAFRIQESEVAQVLEIPLSDLLADSSIIKTKLRTSYATEMKVPGFKLNDYIVWGATAMILSEIKDLLKQVL